MRYRKLPVEVDAVQNDGEWSTIISWLDSLADGKLLIPFGTRPPVTRNPDGTLNIETLEGVVRCDVGDYLIRGVKGEMYPCKPDIFAVTYEEVT